MLSEDLQKVFEKNEFLWFSMEWENLADGQVCKYHIVHSGNTDKYNKDDKSR